MEAYQLKNDEFMSYKTGLERYQLASLNHFSRADKAKDILILKQHLDLAQSVKISDLTQNFKDKFNIDSLKILDKIEMDALPYNIPKTYSNFNKLMNNA